MDLRYATPGELVDGLQQRVAGARAQLWQQLREPVGKLMDELLTRQKLDHGRERVVTHALHTAETFLRTRAARDFAAMNWHAFRAAVLLHLAKQAYQPFGGQAGNPAGPAPLPESPAYQSAVISLPSERIGNYWFGGDWFAGRLAPDGALWVIVADITGHGYYAYLLASSLPHVWHACWEGCPDDAEPASLLAAMHELLADCLPDGVYVECTLVRLAPDGEATVAPAGGSRLLLRRGGTARPDLLKLRGTWLGLSPPGAGDQRTWRLDAGDELLLGTDGVFDHLADEHGADRVEWPAGVADEGTLLDAVQTALRDALRRAPQKDDITMVLVRRREPAARRAAVGPAAGPAARSGAEDVSV